MRAKDVLIAAEGEDPNPLRAELKRLRPDIEVHADGEAYDPSRIGFAAVWFPRPGLMASLPNLAAIFSLVPG